MKIIHLSDLHLGKCILEQSLIEDQRYILKEIIEIIKAKQVEVVLVCGDVYDKGIPSVEAVRLFSDFLSRLYELKIKVFVISGNHDSKDRLVFGNDLFVDNGVYIEGIFEGDLKKVELVDDYGKILIYMLPFVKPCDVKRYYPDVEINSYQKAIECIVANENVDTEVRNIIMVHQFVTASGVDVERSESEKLSLGGIDNVDVSLFDKFDYVAMGHVHRSQKLIRDTVRYAGSPLKYSFSEVNHSKNVVIIDVKEKGNVEIELVPLIPVRDMRLIKGKLENLIDRSVVELGNCDDYISAIVTDEDYIVDAIGKLRRVYKNILKLEYSNKRSILGENKRNLEVEMVQKFSELELFKLFYKQQNNIGLDDQRKNIVIKVIDYLKERNN